MPSIDDLVAAYDEAFGGILVEGFDLASVNRGSFYISLLSGAPFLSPSRPDRKQTRYLASISAHAWMME